MPAEEPISQRLSANERDSCSPINLSGGLLVAGFCATK